MARTQRVRKQNDSKFVLNNIIKGAEKRAADDFAEGSIQLNDLKGISMSACTMTKEFVNGNVHEITNSLVASTSNGEKSKTLRNFLGVSKLGFTYISDRSINCSNNENLKVLQTKNENVFYSKENLKELNETLIKSGTIKPEEKLKVGHTDAFKDLKKIERKLNVYSSKKLGYDISRLNPSKLKELLEKATEANNTELVNVIETQFGINELLKKSSGKIQRCPRMGGQVRRLVNMNVNNETLKGYNTLRNYKFITRTLVKGTMIYYKGIAKGLIKTGDFLVRGTGFALNKAHLHSAARAVFETRNKVASGFDKVGKGYQNFKVGIRNMREQAPGTIIHGMVETGRMPGRVISSGARHVHAKVRSTRAYHNAAKTARSTMSRVTNSRTGSAVKSGLKVGRRVTKKIAQPVKLVGKIFTKPFNILKGVFKSTLRGLNFVSLLIKKIIIALGVSMAGLAVASTGFVAVVVSITMIGEAITNSYENFCETTAMGKAYLSLIEQEKLFFDGVSNMYKTITVPTNADGYAIQGIFNYGEQKTITKFEGTTIEFLDGNGIALYGNDRYNTKSILAMAAIYIDQDFTKYSGIAGLFGGVYQDYCNRLYKSSHSAYLNLPNQSEVYYCGEYDASYGGYKKASDCTNSVHINHGTWTSDDDDPSPCQNYTERELTHDDGDCYIRYRCLGHDYCTGHINSHINVVISNAYHPEDYDNIVLSEDKETNNNLYDVDSYGNAYWYGEASDTVLGEVGSVAMNIANALISVPLTYLDINLGEEIVDYALGTTVYYEFKGEKVDGLGNEYKFKVYMGEPNRNFDGWTSDNIYRVKALLAGDWYELYHIDFETDLAGIEFDSGFSYLEGYEVGEYLGGNVGVPISNYYNQGNYPNYAMKAGCSSTIKSAGCGFCSLAMVANTLTGDDIFTPIYVVNQLAGDFYVCGEGGSHSLPTAGAARLGLNGTQLSTMSSTSFAEVLDEGGLVIALIGNPHAATEFYSGKGHFIVIRGITESGKIVVADPGRRDNNSKEWPISQLRLRKAWAIYAE